MKHGHNPAHGHHSTHGHKHMHEIHKAEGGKVDSEHCIKMTSKSDGTSSGAPDSSGAEGHHGYAK